MYSTFIRKMVPVKPNNTCMHGEATTVGKNLSAESPGCGCFLFNYSSPQIRSDQDQTVEHAFASSSMFVNFLLQWIAAMQAPLFVIPLTCITSTVLTPEGIFFFFLVSSLIEFYWENYTWISKISSSLQKSIVAACSPVIYITDVSELYIYTLGNKFVFSVFFRKFNTWPKLFKTYTPVYIISFIRTLLHPIATCIVVDTVNTQPQASSNIWAKLKRQQLAKRVFAYICKNSKDKQLTADSATSHFLED